MSDPVYEAVRTRQMDIVDDAGNTRINMASSAGGVALIVIDENQVGRAALYHRAKVGPAVDMWGADGVKRLRVSADERGANTIEIYDTAGRIRLLVIVGGAAAASPDNVAVDLLDANQTARVSVSFNNERGNVVIYDAQGTYRALLGVDGGNNPALLLNKDGLPGA